MRVHSFQHVAFEGLASIEPLLTSQGHTLTKTLFHLGSPLPHPGDVDALIVLGGPMSVNDEAQFPWLAEEKAFLREFLPTGKPVLGICLGAQLIASSLGARVYPNPHKEIGWFPLHPVVPSPLGFEDKEMVFHWHGETFDLPDGAVRIASTQGCVNQAFLWKAKVLGLQFHAEVVPSSVAALVEACGDELVPGPFIQTRDQIEALTSRWYLQANRRIQSLLSILWEES